MGSGATLGSMIWTSMMRVDASKTDAERSARLPVLRAMEAIQRRSVSALTDVWAHSPPEAR